MGKPSEINTNLKIAHDIHSQSMDWIWKDGAEKYSDIETLFRVSSRG